MFTSLSPEALMQTLAALPVRVFWKDRDSRFLGCNQLFADDAGIADPSTFVGKSDYYFFNTDQAAAFRADDLAVMEIGRAKLGIEERLTLTTGEVRWLETNKLPIRNEAGEIVGVLGVYHDITDRKRAQLGDCAVAA